MLYSILYNHMLLKYNEHVKHIDLGTGGMGYWGILKMSVLVLCLKSMCGIHDNLKCKW